MKKQLIYQKKIYAIDNGLRNQVAIRFSDDSGKLLENAVHTHLRRSGKEIYYFKEKRECDFIIKEKTKIIAAIQVTDTLLPNNEERELTGLLEAMQAFHLKQGYIITRSQEERRKSGAHELIILPIHRWLLNFLPRRCDRP